MATPPRQVIPGKVVEVSNRTVRRMFLLKPSPKVRHHLRYLLAHYATKYNITLYAGVFMFNHYHLLLRDNDGRLPEFMETLNSMIARAINAIHGERGDFWKKGAYDDVEIVDPADQRHRIDYILGNPLAADLVDSLDEWPHVIVRPEDVGRDVILARPDELHGERSKLPEVAVLRFEVPPEFEHLGVAGYRKWLRKRIRRLEHENRRRRATEGRTVLGIRRLLQVERHQMPSSNERLFGMNPRIAAKDPGRRVQAIHQLQSFRSRYREAYEALQSGRSGVRFPFGTWLMRVRFGCATEPPPHIPIAATSVAQREGG